MGVHILQGSRLGAIHVQLALLLKPDAVKPLLARSACAGKPRDPPGARHSHHPRQARSACPQARCSSSTSLDDHGHAVA